MNTISLSFTSTVGDSCREAATKSFRTAGVSVWPPAANLAAVVETMPTIGTF